MKSIHAMLGRLTAAASALALAAVIVGGAYGAAHPTAVEAASTAQRDSSYVGEVSGIDAFVGIVSNGSRVTAYVCDSETIAEWFRGAVTGDTVELTSAGGARLVAQLSGDTASGTFHTVDGREFAFSASLTTGRDSAGLYRAVRPMEGSDAVGGWIVRSDGSLRGAIVHNGEINPSPSFVIFASSISTDRDDGAGSKSLAVILPGFGMFSADRLDVTL